MELVKVNKVQLLATLTANSASHRAMFEEAQVGYREEVIKQLDIALGDAQKNKKFTTLFRIPAPIDQTADYDRAIRMLEFSIEDEIELSERDFAQYVMDDWSWKQDFVSNAMMYTKMK